jgi:hypothetical protein
MILRFEVVPQDSHLPDQFESICQFKTYDGLKWQYFWSGSLFESKQWAAASIGRTAGRES